MPIVLMMLSLFIRLETKQYREVYSNERRKHQALIRLYISFGSVLLKNKAARSKEKGRGWVAFKMLESEP